MERMLLSPDDLRYAILVRLLLKPTVFMHVNDLDQQALLNCKEQGWIKIDGIHTCHITESGIRALNRVVTVKNPVPVITLYQKYTNLFLSVCSTQKTCKEIAFATQLRLRNTRDLLTEYVHNGLIKKCNTRPCFYIVQDGEFDFDAISVHPEKIEYAAHTRNLIAAINQRGVPNAAKTSQ